MSSDNIVDIIIILICLYLFISTYRQKREIAYKIFWYIPYCIAFIGATCDLSGILLGETGNTILKLSLYSTLIWAVVYSFGVTAYLKKKHNQALKEDADNNSAS